MAALSHIILSQTCAPAKLRNDSIEDIIRWIITLKEIDFDDPVKDAKSFADFSPPRQFRVERTDVT